MKNTVFLKHRKVLSLNGNVTSYWFMNNTWKEVSTGKIGRTTWYVLNNSHIARIAHNTSNRQITIDYFPHQH